MSHVPVAGTPVGYPIFKLTIRSECKKWDHPTDDATEDHCSKRAHSGTEEANEVSSSETVPASGHSLNQFESEPIEPPSNPAKNPAKCLLVTMVFCISVTSIHGSHLLSLGDREVHRFLQLCSWCMVMIEGSLVVC